MYVPNGLRVVESLLARRFPPEDIAVCYPDQIDQIDRFVGEDTRVVGVHAHNPLGITFATDVYAGLYGANYEPINAAEFRRLIRHPSIQRHYTLLNADLESRWRFAKRPEPSFRYGV